MATPVDYPYGPLLSRPDALPISHAAHDRRCRGDRDHPGGRLAHADGDVDLAVVAEVRAWFARARVHRHQPRVERALDDARGTGRVGREWRGSCHGLVTGKLSSVVCSARTRHGAPTGPVGPGHRRATETPPREKRGE